MNIKIWTLSSGKGFSGLEHFLIRIAKNWWSRWQGRKCSRGCHSYTSKIHFRTESWLRTQVWPRAGEGRTPRDRLTTQAGRERDENLGYFKNKIILKGQRHSKTNPSTSVARLYPSHMVLKLNGTGMSAHQHSTMEQGHILHCKCLIISKLPFLLNQRPYWNLCVSFNIGCQDRAERSCSFLYMQPHCSNHRHDTSQGVPDPGPTKPGQDLWRRGQLLSSSDLYTEAARCGQVIGLKLWATFTGYQLLFPQARELFALEAPEWRLSMGYLLARNTNR